MESCYLSPFPSLWVVLFTLLFLFAATGTPSIAVSQDAAQKSIAGVYTEELPTPIFYDTFLPVIYEYILPHWNRSDVTFNNWYNCTTETAPYRYTCPSVYHMNRAILNLHIDFLALQPITDSVPHTEYYTRLQAHSSFCDLIQRHFSGVYIQDDELGVYIRSLEKCNTGGTGNDVGLVFVERTLPDFNFSIRHPFTKMESNFYNVFYKSINGVNGTTMDLVASATLSNARATIQGTLLSVYYAEKYRWAHAVQDCAAQLVPHSLITSQKFQDKLDNISKHEKFRTNFDFSIPMDLISKYFSLPITDCTYTNSTYVVRLQIPVTLKVKSSVQVPNQQSRQLITFTPVPFLYRNKICSIQVDSRQRYAVDKNNMVAYKTKCKSNELCLISDTFSQRFIDRCASALIIQDFQDVLTYCKFECSTHIFPSIAAKDNEQGIVTRVGTDKYVLIAHDTKAIVNCPTGKGPSPPPASSRQSPTNSYDADSYEIAAEKDGAIEVTLPCSCNIEVNHKRFFPSEGYCGQDLKISHIIPWHMIRDKDKEGDDLKADEVLINFYTKEVSRDETMHWIHSDTGKTAASVQEGPSLLPLWIFFILVSIILFLIQCYIIYLFRQSPGAYTGRQLFFKAREPEPHVRLLEPSNNYDQHI